ncbi:DUF255 domain-containing protein [Verrucomicrobiaceae bacterium 227]
MVLKTFRLSPLLICLGLGLASCDEQKNTNRQERFDKDNFFSGIEKTSTVAELENEMAGGETDFLKSFAADSLPWQHWDPTILEKAKQCQAPVFLLIGNALGGESRAIGREISESSVLRSLLADQFVCAVADVHANPELGTLSYHLSTEIKRSTNFPTLVWMSHEGSPIAWIPIAGVSGRDLEVVITNSTAMVSRTWNETSDYAVNNSRNDNKTRQKRLASPIPEKDSGLLSRTRVFKGQTRQLSSLYSPGDRDLDFIGGLIPTSSLELLALGSVSNLVTEEVNERCHQATTEVIEEILKGALKDHLDGSYFYARRTSDWSLPSFSKSIATQAKVVHMLIQAGTITGRQDFIEEALGILDLLDTRWMEKPQILVAPSGDQNTPGKFLWNWSTLEKAVGRDLVPFTAAAFSLEKNGNIPTVVDPLSQYFKLNSIRSRKTIPELATDLGLTGLEARETLEEVKARMLAFREKTTQFNIESVMSCSDLALILRAWTAAAVVSRDPAYLEKAQSLVGRLSREFVDPEKGLARLSLDSGFTPARASDYGNTSIALTELYQVTLNPTYLKLSKSLIDEALVKLKCDNGLVSEAPDEGRVIPLKIVQPAMIFSDSPLGLIDLAVTQLRGVTGNPEYNDFRKKVSTIIEPRLKAAIVNHTDYIATCAYGNSPVVAIFQGDPASEAGRTLLLSANSRKYTPFLSIRAESGPAPLIKLEGFPERSGEASMIIILGGEIIGQVSDSDQLKELINKALFTHE